MAKFGFGILCEECDTEALFFGLIGRIEEGVEAETEDEETEDDGCNASGADIEISDDEPPAEGNEESGG